MKDRLALQTHTGTYAGLPITYLHQKEINRIANIGSIPEFELSGVDGLVGTVIGITARPGNIDGQPAQFVFDGHVKAVRESGGIPYIIPLLELESEYGDIAEHAAENFSGIVFTGGTDVNPALYGAEPHPKTDEPNAAHDNTQFRLLYESMKNEIPILAICAGLQRLNVSLGGTLHQHLETIVEHNMKQPRNTPVHDVELVKGTRLQDIYGVDSLRVNSTHHQAVDRRGTGLVVAARSPSDGVIEGTSHYNKFIVGIQWHPEALLGEMREHLKPYQALVSAAQIK